MYQTTIECTECRRVSSGKDNSHQIRRFEYALDLNLDIPTHGSRANLQDMIQNQFQEERIEGYNCIKCSIRQYLLSVLSDHGDRLFSLESIQGNTKDIDWTRFGTHTRASLSYMHFLYKTPDIDENDFVSMFQHFKRLTSDTTTHALRRVKCTILKSKKIIKPPKTLCIHFNRLAYDANGDTYLNQKFVEFQEEFLLTKKACEFDLGQLKYRICAVIEHTGTPRYGHYITSKRLLKPLQGNQLSQEPDFLYCNDGSVQPISVQTV